MIRVSISGRKLPCSNTLHGSFYLRKSSNYVDYKLIIATVEVDCSFSFRKR